MEYRPVGLWSLGSCASLVACLLCADCNRDNGALPSAPAPDAAVVPCGTPIALPPDPQTVPTLLRFRDPQSTAGGFLHTRFDNQQVAITAPTRTGKLVVTSVFADAFVVGDTGLPYVASSGLGGFNHLYVHQTPLDPGIVMGREICRVEGLLTRPTGFAVLEARDVAIQAVISLSTVPTAVVLSVADRASSALFPRAAATVQTTATICPIDETTKDWTQFKQFSLDYGDRVCDSFQTFSVALTSQVLGTFNPLQHQGKPLRVTGMLRNDSGQNEKTTPPTLCKSDTDCSNTVGGACIDGSCKKGVYSFWTIVPRTVADLQLL